LVDDEEVTLSELNHICGDDQHVFSRVGILKKRLLVIVRSTKDQEEGIGEEEHCESNLGTEATVKSKILSHFIKGKISLTPMETILIILGELEFLEGLVKLAGKRKDVEGHKNHVAAIHTIPTIRRVNVNMPHRNKTLHLVVEINQALIEGLVDTRASMLVIVANVVRELGIMHLMVGHETYKITSRLVPYALKRIT
jgi:hypothetical protein